MADIRIAAVLLVGAVATLNLTACSPPSPGPSPSASPAPSSSITIENPADDDSITTPIALNGTSDTFEAALTVDVLDADGNTMCIRNILATAGSGTSGTWQSTLAVVPGDIDAPVTVRAYEFSAADGSVVNLVEHTVTLSAAHPPIFITSPGCGATASPGSALAVAGRAFVFEAQFTLELRDSSGAPVLSVPVTAASGTEESDWSMTLNLPPSLPVGDYELVAFDNSAKDGSVENEFAIPVTIE